MPNFMLVAIKKVFNSFMYAFKGIKYAFASQLNFRVQITLGILAIAAGIYLHISTSEWLWLSLCIAFVLSFELLNTAIETLTDLVSPGYNEKAGQAKDVAAAAVTIAALFALTSALIIFIPKIIRLF